MKIIIRFCSQWGNYSTKVHVLSRNGIPVDDFKDTIRTLTDIEPQKQVLMFIQAGQKIQLKEGHLLSDYGLTDGCMVYVNQAELEESKEQDGKQCSLVSQRYFSKLGIIQEESFRINLSMNSCEDDSINNMGRPNCKWSPYMESLQEFINFIRWGDWDSANKVFQKFQNKGQFPGNETKCDFPRTLSTNCYKDLINDTSLCGWNAFHHACFIGNQEIVIQLMKLKAEINLPNRDNWSPLQLAIQKNNCSVIQSLTDRMDLDVNHSSNGATGLQMAAKKGLAQVVSLIINHPNLNINEINLDDFDTAQCTSQCFELIAHRICQHQQCAQIILRENLRTYTEQSFLEIVSTKPSGFKGYLHKLNFFPLISYRRYFVLDPDDGTFTRYHEQEDYPLKPIQIIALANIKSVQEIFGYWYMESDANYLEIKYTTKKNHVSELLVSSKQKDTITTWRESMMAAIKYSQYLDNKLTNLYKDGKVSQISLCMNEVFTNRMTPQHIRSSISPPKAAQQRGSGPPFQKMASRETQFSSEIYLPIDSAKHGGNLGQFQILKMIGNGSFGKVFQVMHKCSKKVYAMKQLSKSKLISKRQIKYAVSECNILKQVSSPYIINLFQSFQTPQYLYLIMEYCAGGDLALHLSRLGTFKEPTTRLIIRELILAMEHLHQLDILYRDLKPENILLDPSGHLKLVDFGLSKQVHTGMTAKSFCGSPAYLAPEMLTGRGATKATDVYGLGTVMFELLTGDPPYFHEDIDILYQNIRQGHLKIPNYISPDARTFLEQILQKDPTKRPGCNNPNSIDWQQLRSATWFGDCFNDLEKPIRLTSNEDTVDWVSDDSSDSESYHNKILDHDYEQHNQKINRVLNWSFDKL